MIDFDFRPLNSRQPFITAPQGNMDERAQRERREMILSSYPDRLKAQPFFCKILKGAGRITLQRSRRQPLPIGRPVAYSARPQYAA